jgi:hypothetical protein
LYLNWERGVFRGPEAGTSAALSAAMTISLPDGRESLIFREAWVSWEGRLVLPENCLFSGLFRYEMSAKIQNIITQYPLLYLPVSMLSSLLNKINAMWLLFVVLLPSLLQLLYGFQQ